MYVCSLQIMKIRLHYLYIIIDIALAALSYIISSDTKLRSYVLYMGPISIVKTEKAQEQDGFGNKMKYHFHIITIHKYHLFVFCLSSCAYLCRVVMWKWYFILLPKPSCSCAFSVLTSLHLY